MLMFANHPEMGADCITYNGSASGQDLNFGFSPDLFLTKDTAAAAGRLFDSAGSNRPFDTSDVTPRLSAVTGFSFGTGKVTVPENAASISTTGHTFYALGMKKGAQFGLDIVTWTGDGNPNKTVSHGLGASPDFIFARRVDSSLGVETPAWWRGYSVTAFEVELGNLFNVGSGDSSYFTGTVSSSSFQVGSNLNANGASYIAYVFRSVAGFSMFGTYTGTGTSKAVTTGFAPGFVLIKKLNPTGTGVREIDFNYRRSLTPTVGSISFSSFADDTGHSVTLGASSFTLGNGDNAYNVNGWDYGYWAVAQAAMTQ